MKVVDELSGYNHEVYESRFLVTQNRKFLCVASNTAVFRVVDIEEKKNRFVYGHGDMVLCLAVRDNFILTGSKDSSIKLWRFDFDNETNVGECTLLCTFRGHINEVTNISFSCNETFDFFYSVSSDNTLKKWPIPESVLTTTKPKLMNSALLSTIPHEKDINAVRVSRNNKLVATCSNDRYVKLFSSQDLKQIGEIKAHKRGVWDI